MSTYCISDIHGYLDNLLELLDLVAFGADDVAYILGDICDRGPDSAQTLVWAVDEAPPNIRFLCGNHEDMALEVVEHNPSWLQQKRKKNLWVHNGGQSTASHLKKMTDSAWRRTRLLPWLQALPVYEKVSVGGKPYMLVHAGFDTARFDGNAGRDPYGGKPGGYLNVRAESELLELVTAARTPAVYDVGDGFGRQGRDEMLWLREEWYLSPEKAPCHVIHGHSAFSWRDIDKIRLASPDSVFSGCPGRICHYFGNRHNIDCGASEGCPPYNLGALRLEDFEEFYIPIR